MQPPHRRDLRGHRCPPVSRGSVFPSAYDNSGLHIIEIARIHPFSGKPQVCGKLGALRQKCHFATRNKIILIITRAREITLFRSATLFGNTLSVAGKVNARHLSICVPQTRGTPKIAACESTARFLGKRQNNAAAHAGWRLRPAARRALLCRAAERKPNAEPRFAAADIWLSLKSRKNFLSLSKNFS